MFAYHERVECRGVLLIWQQPRKKVVTQLLTTLKEYFGVFEVGLYDLLVTMGVLTIIISIVSISCFFIDPLEAPRPK